MQGKRRRGVAGWGRAFHGFRAEPAALPALCLSSPVSRSLHGGDCNISAPQKKGGAFAGEVHLSAACKHEYP